MTDAEVNPEAVIDPQSVGGTCPACGAGGLLQHGNVEPIKAGAIHCNNCGCCWKSDLSAVRPGTATLRVVRTTPV